MNSTKTNKKKLIEIKVLTPVEAYSNALKSLKKLYSTSDGKKFINHLIYAFLFDARPIVYTEKLTYDCITRSRLSPFYSPETVPSEVLDKYNLTESTYGDLSGFILDEKLYPARLAFYSTKSNKLIGASELQALKDFINEVDDDTITKLINYINPNKKVRVAKSFSPSTRLKTGWTIADSEELKSKLDKLK